MSEPATRETSGARRPSVVVLDYGFGNVRSAVRALERVGADVELTADRARAQESDGLVVPGVGAFAAVMAGLRGVRGDELVGRRLAGGRPVLGICVGMQVMFEQGDEHGTLTDGLGEWSGLVDRLEADVVPHMGWDTVDVPEGSVLFRGVEDERFYFVHSYAARSFTTGQDLPADSPIRRPLVTWSDHGGRFVAAVENGPLSATQFHPEKSGDAGAALLENWVRSL
jgi:glutamine amidotransferase